MATSLFAHVRHNPQMFSTAVISILLLNFSVIQHLSLALTQLMGAGAPDVGAHTPWRALLKQLLLCNTFSA
jgi:hypothetical protein